MNRRIFLLEQSPELPGGTGTGNRCLVAVCSMSKIASFKLATGKFSESECKGTTIPRTDKIFSRFFSEKTQLFSTERHIGTQSTGLHEHKMHETCAKEAEKTANFRFQSLPQKGGGGLSHSFNVADLYLCKRANRDKMTSSYLFFISSLRKESYMSFCHLGRAL